MDDEGEMCASLRKLLGDKGFTVSTALSAKEGFELLQKQSADMILCDIAMPDMSGLMFLSKVSPRIPVIMMTSAAQAAGAWKSGAAVEYLDKGFTLPQLLDVVKRILHD